MSRLRLYLYFYSLSGREDMGGKGKAKQQQQKKTEDPKDCLKYPSQRGLIFQQTKSCLPGSSSFKVESTTLELKNHLQNFAASHVRCLDRTSKGLDSVPRSPAFHRPRMLLSGQSEQWWWSSYQISVPLRRPGQNSPFTTLPLAQLWPLWALGELVSGWQCSFCSLSPPLAIPILFLKIDYISP